MGLSRNRRRQQKALYEDLPLDDIDCEYYITKKMYSNQDYPNIYDVDTNLSSNI